MPNLLMFRLLSFMTTGKENEEHGTTFSHCEINITSITCILQDNFNLLFDIISFQHVLHFDVSRSEIEWNMKVKMEI